MITFTEMVLRLGTPLAQLVPLAGVLEPVCLLYGLLAATYAVAASAATRDNHRLLARCYVASAMLHGLIAVCHQLHM